MKLVYSDGGRAVAGYKGETGDCVCRSIAIATGRPYKEVYDELNWYTRNKFRQTKNIRNSHTRTGVYPKVTHRYLLERGWRWVSCMGIGTGCRVHLRDGELPKGKTLLVRLSKHVTVVEDDVIFDTGDPSRAGTRCVYGYYERI